MRIDTILYDEIRSEIENLQNMEKGSEAYKNAVDGLTKLLDRAIEMDKFENDLQMRVDELELKNKQFEHDKKDRGFKIWMDIAGIAVPTLVTIWGTLKCLKFEEEGTVTTIVGRGFINKLFSKK